MLWIRRPKAWQLWKNLAVVIGVVTLLIAAPQLTLSALAESSNSPIVYTPLGPNHADCVHLIPNGSVIIGLNEIQEPNGTVVNFSPCLDPINPASASPSACTWNDPETAQTGSSPSYYGYFKATSTVPSNPTTTNTDWLYLWNGLLTGCSPGTDSVIQSVIQWGDANGATSGHSGWGGKWWQEETWYYLSTTSYYETAPITISAGDSIVGTESTSSCVGGSCDWSVSEYDTTAGIGSGMSCSNTSYICNLSEVYALIALEGGGLTSCSVLPSSSPMTFYNVLKNVAGTTLTPSWSTYADTSICSAMSVSASSTYVSLYF